MAKFVHLVQQRRSRGLLACRRWSFIALDTFGVRRNSAVTGSNQELRPSSFSSILCDVAAQGDLHRLRSVLRQEGADVNRGDYDKRTAIHLASSEGHLHIVQFLVTEQNAEVSPLDRWGWTPLDDAYRAGHTNVASFLKSRGATTGQKIPTSPKNIAGELCDAAASGDVTYLRVLVQEHGADVNQGDYDKRTAIHLAASEGLVAVVRCLVDEFDAQTSPEDRWGRTPLDDAIASHHDSVVKFLAARGATRGSASASVDHAGELCASAARGDLCRLRSLIQEDGVDVNLDDYDRRTAMHLAAAEGLLDVVRCLVEELQADLSPVDRWGNTPLDEAVRSGHPSVIDFLESKGAAKTTVDSDIPELRLPKGVDTSGDNAECSHIVLAKWSKICFYAAKGELEQVKAELAVLAGSNNFSDICSVVSGHKGDYDQRTPLHLAASEGSYQVALWLLKHGAPKDIVDRFGNTPLMCALQGNHHELVKLFVQQGCKVVSDDGQLRELDNTKEGQTVMKRLVENTALVWEIDTEELTRVRFLGQGAFGSVDLYRWRGTPVAVKELQMSTDHDSKAALAGTMAADAAKAEFKQEIRLMSELHHPHVVQFLGASIPQDSEDDDRLKLVLEYMDDGSLHQRFRSPKPPLQQRILWAIHIARGMAYLHGRQPHAVIHRDLKPENVMLKHGVAKVADFGICKTLPALVRNQEPCAATKAYELTAVGTLRYLAPEVYRYETYNHLADVYSFAMILFQLLFWHPPFSQLSCEKAAKKASTNGRPRLPPPRNVPEVSEVLRDLVTGCWVTEYWLRPNFLEILEVLEDELEKIPKDGDSRKTP